MENNHVKSKMSLTDRKELKNIKKEFKLFKTKSVVTFIQQKEELIRLIVSSKTPMWGGLRITVAN